MQVGVLEAPIPMITDAGKLNKGMTVPTYRVPSIALLMMVSIISHAQSFIHDTIPPAPKYEMRAAWIATVANIDWPSSKGLNAQQQQQEFVAILDTLQNLGINAVVVQIRPVADALFPSSYEPWSEYLSGQQGQPVTPYYNPLAFMIHEVHKRAMEFHAWFNPYRASMKEGFEHAPNHPIHSHPEWFVEYGKKMYYNPGLPEAREFVLNAIMEVVRHYDVDAVHFDDYFYPYRVANEEFPDDSTYWCYAPAFMSKEDWRRSNTDYFVHELHKRLRKEKPHVKFGISPFGVWRNKSADPDGSETTAGTTNYDDLYADVRKWLKEGWIDYVVPQLYWHRAHPAVGYQVLLDWWAAHAYGRHLYIGQGVYRMGQKGWEDAYEINQQIALNRGHETVQGSVYFSTKTLRNNQQQVQQRLHELYPTKALIPSMPWLNSTPPQAPVWTAATGSQGMGVTLHWKDTIPSGAQYYVIYRFVQNETIALSDPTHIQDIVARDPHTMQTWTDAHTEKHTTYQYVVTAVSRNHIESLPSNPVTLKTKGARRSIRLQD